MPVQLALLDDHQIVIDGLKLLLAGHPEFDIQGEFNKGYDLLESLKHKPADIVLTDIMMPEMDGFEVALRIHKEFPNTRVLALSMNDDGMLIDQMIEQAGVSGYLLKTAGKDELVTALRAVSSGETYFSREILTELHSYRKIKKENEDIHLTAREIDIIRCMAEDLSNREIAERLFISERTVETHRKNIFRKTGMHSAMSLVEFARKRKLI